MNIGERVKFIRDKFGLNQQEFGKKINISRSQIAAIENSLRIMTDRVIADTCREFNINEEWLRTEQGEIFIQRDEITLDEYAKKKNATPLEIEIIKGFLELDEGLRKDLMNHFRNIFLKEEETSTTKEYLPPDLHEATSEATEMWESKERKLG